MIGMWKWEAEHDAKGVIVLVPSVMEQYQKYSWVIEMWRSSGYHVIMGDLPGQEGNTRSQKAQIDSFEAYTKEIRDWIQTAYQFELPIFLMGHGLGGLIVARIMEEEDANLAGVILTSPFIKFDSQSSKKLNKLTAGLNKVAPKMKVTHGITAEMATRNETIRKNNTKDSFYDSKITVRWISEIFQAMKQTYIDLDKMSDVPTLLIQPGNDKIVDVPTIRDWFNRMPLSEKHYKEWKDSYHEWFTESDRDEIFQFAKGFVETRLRTIGYVI